MRDAASSAEHQKFYRIRQELIDQFSTFGILRVQAVPAGPHNAHTLPLVPLIVAFGLIAGPAGRDEVVRTISDMEFFRRERRSGNDVIHCQSNVAGSTQPAYAAVAFMDDGPLLGTDRRSRFPVPYRPPFKRHLKRFNELSQLLRVQLT
jgi:hypothetical protein